MEEKVYFWRKKLGGGEDFVKNWTSANSTGVNLKIMVSRCCNSRMPLGPGN